jgi:mRNA interferase MazF
MVSRRGRSGGRVVTRGEVWLAVLDPTIGSEIQKTRPCLIVSPPEINDYLRTSIVAPMTTGGRPAPYRIPVNFRGRAGLVVLDQIRTVDEQRLVRRLGAVGMETLRNTLTALREMFDE